MGALVAEQHLARTGGGTAILAACPDAQVVAGAGVRDRVSCGAVQIFPEATMPRGHDRRQPSNHPTMRSPFGQEVTMAKLHLGDLKVSSPAFKHGGAIPDEHAADGPNVSPEVTWQGVPSGTRELALVVHDPDAPLTDGFTHWVVYGIPPETKGIPKGGGSAFTEGQSDFGSAGYGGPAPPPGHGTHHYYVHLYALDEPLNAGPGLTRKQLLDRMDDHIIEQARVVGTYSR